MANIIIGEVKRLPWITSSGLWGDHSPRCFSTIQPDCLDCLREEGRNRSLLANPPGLRPLLANVHSQGRWIRDPSPPQHPRSSCRNLQADRDQTSRGLQLGEGRWTLCLYHWCLALSVKELMNLPFDYATLCCRTMNKLLCILKLVKAKLSPKCN